MVTVECTFEGIEHAHGTAAAGGIAGNLNLIGRGNRGGGLFSVRL